MKPQRHHKNLSNYHRRARGMHRLTGIDPDEATNFLNDFGAFCCIIADFFEVPITHVDCGVLRSVNRARKTDQQRALEDAIPDAAIQEVLAQIPAQIPEPKPPDPDLDALLNQASQPEPKPQPLSDEELQAMFG